MAHASAPARRRLAVRRPLPAHTSRNRGASTGTEWPSRVKDQEEHDEAGGANGAEADCVEGAIGADEINVVEGRCGQPGLLALTRWAAAAGTGSTARRRAEGSTKPGLTHVRFEKTGRDDAEREDAAAAPMSDGCSTGANSPPRTPTGHGATTDKLGADATPLGAAAATTLRPSNGCAPAATALRSGPSTKTAGSESLLG